MVKSLQINFSTWVCKFFSKAIRQDTLIEVANGGCIFTPGSVGTRQEVFQCATQSQDNGGVPMIFYNSKFWHDNGVFPVIHETSKGHAYHELLLCTDDANAIVEHLKTFTKSVAL